MRQIATATLLCLATAGCSMTLPVRGNIQNSDETFTGTATGHLDGAGTLSITTTTGATCHGDFVYTTNREGDGTFVCSDGRTGPFHFVSTGTHGTGSGDLGNQKVTFTFGK